MKSSSPPPLSSADRTLTIGLVFILTVGFGAVGIRYLKVMSEKGGGVTALPSPEDKYLAMARALTKEQFWGGRREYFELTVSKREIHENDPNHPWRYHPDRTVVVDRIAGLPFPSERGTEACGIRWLPDASQVTFDFHGVTIDLPTKDL